MKKEVCLKALTMILIGVIVSISWLETWNPTGSKNFVVCCFKACFTASKNSDDLSEERLKLSDAVSVKLPILETELVKAGYYCKENVSEIEAHSAKQCTYLPIGEEKESSFIAVYQNPYDIAMPVSELPITTIYVKENRDITLGSCKIGIDKEQVKFDGNWKGNVFQTATDSHSLKIICDHKKISSFMYSFQGKGWWDVSGP